MNIKEMVSKNKADLKQMFLEIKDKKTRKKQIPNMLTLSRLLAPFLIIPCSIVGAFPLALSFITIFSITDLLDGYIARKYNLTSDIGKKLDALSDKIFAGTLLLSLINLNPIFIITLFLELIIGGINIKQMIDGNNPKSHMLGKIKTTFLYTSITLFFASLYLKIPKVLLDILFITTSFFQVQSAYKYCKIGKELKMKKKLENDAQILIDELDREEVQEKSNEKNNTKEKYIKMKEILLTEKKYLEQDKEADKVKIKK